MPIAPTPIFSRGRMRAAALFVALVTLTTLPAAGQGVGGIVGTVVDAATNRALRGAEIRIDGGRRLATTDTAGNYRVRGVPIGSHRIDAIIPGYRPAHRDSIVVRADEFTRADIRMAPVAVQLADLKAVGVQDPVLDPLATSTAQRITEADLRRLPVSSLEDALSLQAGVVGESYRGGRVGQQSFLLDGFGVKNQLDASTGGPGIRIPPDIITEASLITNGFSARYGQALSGIINVITRDGGDHWQGRAAYETDRPLSGSGDLGLDRVVLQADGPIAGKVTAVVIGDVQGRLDADPANAPAPTDPRDPRSSKPSPLPHNSGETYTLGGKLTIPMGERLVSRFFALGTTEQRYLYDQQYKYNPEFAPGRRVDGKLMTGHLQILPGASSKRPLVGDVRLGYFSKEFVRGAVTAPDYKFGAFTGERLHIQGEELAKRQDTVAARTAITGFEPPQFSNNTPYGVQAFFLSGASQGEIAWNRFTELRSQVDMTLSMGEHTEVYFGGLAASQNVKTFQRVQAYRPVGGLVPPATASNFKPLLTGAYLEAQARTSDLAFTAGLRYDGFDPGSELASQNKTLGARSTINPRIAVSTVLKNATVVASIGRFSQAPDLQFLVDAAFDDTTRTGRFRQGNPNLGFESATQFELSGRIRLREHTSLRINVYTKNLDGLVATAPVGVNPDSSVFVNADVGNVIGGEFIFEKERSNGWGARLAAVVQRAEATVTDAFELRRLVQIDPNTGDTLAAPARASFPLDYDRRLSLIATIDGELTPYFGPKILGVRPFGSLLGAAVFRYGSGLPYSKTDVTGDNLAAEPNGSRLPSQYTLDMLFRRPVKFGSMVGGLYLDARNVLNTRNQTSVRRDTGNPYASEETITRMATDAYNANPAPIPYESNRYRRSADLNGDGVIAGQNELLPLYTAAARDYTQPLFVYGPPRLVRFGIEVLF